MIPRAKCPCRTFLLAALLLSAGGCVAPATLRSWQRGVETYVRQEGKGDPAALRDVTWKETRRGFSVLGGVRPKNSTDFVGPLLGNVDVGGHPWIVFLVGEVDQEKVKAIRIAAFSVKDDRFTWQIGESDSDALKTYRDYNKDLARRRFPDRRSEPPQYLGFPRAEDQFVLAIESATIDVTHTASGAKWRLVIPSMAPAS